MVVGAITSGTLRVYGGNFLEEVDADGTIIIGVEYFMMVSDLSTDFCEIIPPVAERMFPGFQVFLQCKLINFRVVLKI